MNGLKKTTIEEMTGVYLEKGYEIRMTVTEGLTRFAEIVLLLTNTKCSNNSEAQIMNIETVYDSNDIIVQTKNKEIGKWLKSLSGNEVEVEEKVFAIFDNYFIQEVVEQNATFIEGEELLKEVEVIDVVIVADNNF